MELTCLFDKNGVGNPYFKLIYETVFKKLKEHYPSYDFFHEQPNYENGHYFSNPGGGSNFQIINKKNNNSILLSFWDRGMDPLKPGLGWEKYNILQYIGGLSMTMSSEEIKEKHSINHIPFQYPLGTHNAYEYIEEHKTDYEYDRRIKKAVFIGAIYQDRKDIVEYIKKHPYVEIIENNRGFTGREYFKEIAKYRLAISFNGNGEFCLRDLECMGLNMPTVRSELKTRFYNDLRPNFHYLRASESCPHAWFTYAGINKKAIADQFIDCIEKNIDDFEMLSFVAKNGRHYFDNYSRPEYICDLFIKLAKIDEL